MFVRLAIIVLGLSLPQLLPAETVSYEFDIDTRIFNITGIETEALTVAGQIPAPTLEARVGDTLRVTFNNRLNETTSVHWHGVLLPNNQDGVPNLNTQPIQPGESFTFEYPITHAGTYWYHSHTELQIQRGVYGVLVFREAEATAEVEEHVVLFSDWTDESPDTVLNNLKKDDDFYAFKRNNVQSWDKVLANGSQSVANRLQSNLIRMPPMDLADVGYDAFLVNGQTNGTLLPDNQQEGQIKLRMVNGSTSSYFDVEYAGGPMTVVAADGLAVEPVQVQRLRFSTAETYDVLVDTAPGFAYELRANSFDGSGHSSLFVGAGTPVAAPDLPPPNLFLIDHSAMEMEGDMVMGNMADTMMHDHSGAASSMPMNMESAVGVIPHLTDYSQLMSTQDTTLSESAPWHEIPVTLTGNMERYVWSFDGRTLREQTQWKINAGDNVRLIINNDTMMNHPLHLHGHFFRVLNGHGERSPLKHTVNVPPMGRVIIEFAATETNDWLFHCHNQYHMKTGMNRVISYEETSDFDDDTAQAILPFTRWFPRFELAAHNSFTELDFELSDDRYQLEIQADADFDDTYELDVEFSYHFNRFFSAFIGAETSEHHHGKSHSEAIAGFHYMLPLLISSEWRFDNHGNGRIELDSDIQMTRRTGLVWRWNTDEEYRYALRFQINKNLSLSLGRDSEYGDGFGFHYLF